MRSEGFPFYTLGVWGWRCVRWAPFWCPQASATVCERPSMQKVAVPMGKVAKGVMFGGFKCDVASFRVARVALCEM